MTRDAVLSAVRRAARAGALTEDVPVPDVDRRPAAQVGQREGGDAVAAVERAEEREQGLVLIDRQHLAVAERPALGRKREADDPDLGEKGLAHRLLVTASGKGSPRR